MVCREPQPASPPRPPFQFSLRTLLLLFVVLGSSLAVFGGWGGVVFGVAIVLAVCFRQAKSSSRLPRVFAVFLCVLCIAGWLLWPTVLVADEPWGRAFDLGNLRLIPLLRPPSL